MSKEGIASYKASKAREAASKAAGTGYYASHGGGGSSGGSTKNVQYFYNTKTGHTTYRVGGGTPSGVGWKPISKPSNYVGGQARGVATDVDKALKQEATGKKEIEALKATTTAKEKQVMKIEYALQQGMLSKAAAEKARMQQQELMKDLKEKKPVETAFKLGGKTFVGVYGLKREKIKEEIKDPPLSTKRYNEYIGKQENKKPTIPKRKKEWEETIDIITPAPSYMNLNSGTITEYKPPSGKWAGLMYDFRKELETKEIKAIRGGNEGMAGVYGFGSAVTYPFRSPESTGQLFKSFGKGVVVGGGVTILSMTTGPIIPATLIYGGTAYGATQIPTLQENIAESKFHSPVAYREIIAETGGHTTAAIGGAYVGSLLVPATISTYKQWHHKFLASKGSTFEKGNYIWKEGYYSKDALKDWEKTLVKSKFISESQKQAVLKGKGNSVWNKGFLEKGNGKVLNFKQQDFLRQDFYKKVYIEDNVFRLKIDSLALPDQATQTLLGFERFNIDPVARADLQLSNAARIKASINTNQYLGKWLAKPNINPKASVGVSYPKFSYSEQYTLIDTSGSFFESSYFKTGYYKPVPKLRLEYKPVGKIEIITQKISNIKYPAPKVFAGKKAQLIHSDISPIWEKSDIYTGLTQNKEIIITPKSSVIEEPTTNLWFSFTPFIFEGSKEKTKQDTRLIIINPLKDSSKPVIIQEPKHNIIFNFDKNIPEPIKQVTKTRIKTKIRTIQKQKVAALPIIDTPAGIIPDKKINIIEINKPIPDEKPEPEISPPFGFGFNIPSMPKSRKLRAAMPRARPRSRRKELTIDPFAGLYSVHVSEFAFGKATHPARTKEEKKKFKKRIRKSSMFFPTVEMENFNINKIKL